MRELEFRGLRKEGKGWVYGYLIGKDVIVGKIIDFEEDYFTTEFWYKVMPETVGQYTGLKDKNGKKIFEGDIVKWSISPMYGISEVVYYPASFCLSHFPLEDNQLSTPRFTEKQCEIIGNIHENKELLK